MFRASDASRSRIQSHSEFEILLADLEAICDKLGTTDGSVIDSVPIGSLGIETRLIMWIRIVQIDDELPSDGTLVKLRKLASTDFLPPISDSQIPV